MTTQQNYYRVLLTEEQFPYYQHKGEKAQKNTITAKRRRKTIARKVDRIRREMQKLKRPQRKLSRTTTRKILKESKKPVVLKHPCLYVMKKECGCSLEVHAGCINYWKRCSSHNNKPKMTYRCSKCGKEFKRKKDFKKHRYDHAI